ncbi:hypothetical protein [Motilibacter peucedani]|uniref:hypothetical protein n=1 Tax=Motilibacter peucedani TaxID=598650 RepID=UPI001E5EBC11|nr:hypothetical protein [Motilibacter peucedani]
MTPLPGDHRRREVGAELLARVEGGQQSGVDSVEQAARPLELDEVVTADLGHHVDE